MSFSLWFLFLYTPIPWAAILCLLLYRHNLSKIIHPVKENCSIRDWKKVFQYLAIPLDEPSNSPKEDKRSKIYAISKEISERYPNIKSYTLVFAVISIASIFSSAFTMIGIHSIINSRLALLLSAGLQFVSALPSIYTMQLYLGSIPSPPYRFHLKKNRVGSLLGYLDSLAILERKRKASKSSS